MHNDEIGIVTRPGERRLRWLAAAVALPLFGVVAAFGTVEHAPEPIPVRTVIEPLALSATPVGDSGTIIYFQEDRFRRSDTLTTLIERLGADEGEAATLLRSSRVTRPFRLLLPGTTSRPRSTRSASCARYRSSPTETRFSRWTASAKVSAGSSSRPR